MTMPDSDQSPPSNQSSQKAAREVDKTIVVAVISLVGLIVAALFTLLGNVYETERPIKATTTAQTAEAQGTQRGSEQLTLQAYITPTLGTSTLAPAANLSATLIFLASPSATTTMTPGSAPSLTPLPNPNWSEEQLRVFLVIQRELDAIVANDLSTLAQIYAENAKVVDIRGTPDDDTDDLVYTGWDAIRQRSLKTFNYDWLKATPVNLHIWFQQGTAFATHRGLIVNDNIYNRHVSYYELKQINGEWRIVQLEFDYR